MVQNARKFEPEQQPSFTLKNLRWWMFIFFILVMIINYVDRSSISIAMPLISKELNINPVETGLILSAFGWSYTLMQIPGGWLVDKFKSRKIVATSLITWGIVEAITGIATGVAALTGMRVLLGFFEAPVQNGANASLVRWLRKDELSRGSTLIDGGGPLGTAVGGLFVTGLIIWLGTWRVAFAVIGIITVLIGVVAWLFMRDNPKEHPWISQEEIKYLDKVDAENKVELERAAGSAYQYFKHSSAWMLLVAYFGYDTVMYGLLTWAPSYVSKVQHVSFGMTGVWTFVIFGAGFLGEMFAGQVADRWSRSGTSINVVMRTLLGIAGVGVAVAIILVNYVHSASAALWLITIASFFIRWGGLYWSVPARIAAPNHVGQLAGVMNFAGNVGGTIVPILVGWIFGATGSFVGVFVMFAISGLLMAVGSVAVNYTRQITD